MARYSPFLGVGLLSVTSLFLNYNIIGVLQRGFSHKLVDWASLEGISPSKSRTQSELFDLQDPVWPEQEPQVRKDCKVVFRDPHLQLCHITPFKGGNFGDELGPPITKRILELVYGCSAEDLPTYDLIKIYKTGAGFFNRTRNCLMTVGSLWRMVVTGDHLWGTGVNDNGTVRNRCISRKHGENGLVTNLTVYSSRGPRSREDILKHCPWARAIDLEPVGDAGYLVPYIFPDVVGSLAKPRPEPTKEYCVVPHAQEENNKVFKAVPDHLKLTAKQPWKNMTRALMDCKEVVSSSLHGVILSEALRIPSRRLKLTYRTGSLKFGDFYESLRGAEPSHTNNLTFARQDILKPQSVEEGDLYARRILKTFPIHLFDVQYGNFDGQTEVASAGSAHLFHSSQ